MARGEETWLGLGNMAITLRNVLSIHLSGLWNIWLAEYIVFNYKPSHLSFFYEAVVQVLTYIGDVYL